MHLDNPYGQVKVEVLEAVRPPNPEMLEGILNDAIQELEEAESLIVSLCVIPGRDIPVTGQSLYIIVLTHPGPHHPCPAPDPEHEATLERHVLTPLDITK